jgi:hypothetical protein
MMNRPEVSKALRTWSKLKIIGSLVSQTTAGVSRTRGSSGPLLLRLITHGVLSGTDLLK